MTDRLIAGLVVLLAGIAVGAYVASVRGASEADRMRAEWSAERDSLMDSLAVLEWDAAQAQDRADSLATVAATSVDTVRTYITRWRTRTDTLTLTQTVALADSTIGACEDAVDDCERALSSADSALTFQTRVTLGQSQRADIAEANWEAALDRLDRHTGFWEKAENIALLTVGFLGGYLAGR